jgi:tol-pal system protein YbgF
MQRVLKIVRNTGFRPDFGIRERTRHGSFLALVVGLSLLAGCVTQGDFLRLQERVADYHKRDSKSPDPFARIAQLSTDVDALRQEVRDLQGELELARKEAADALAEVQRTRTALAQGAAISAGSGGSAASGAAAAGGAAGAGAAGAVVAGGSSGQSGGPQPDEELAGYQVALDARRTEDFDGCIEHFTAFLQVYPTSGYADDAAYWLADCTYKNEDYKRAVVRFNAVVSVYPESPKAPDALYRQGESLIKLGPKFHEAARTVFKRVQKDYPKSERASEAAGQLQRLGSGSASN